MSSSKYINIICITVMCLALLITVLFMNGRAFGIESTGSSADDGTFMAEDFLYGDWDVTGAAEIIFNRGEIMLNGPASTAHNTYVQDGDAYIIGPGRYIVSGELTDGSLIIDAGKQDKIYILLENAIISNDDGAGILVKQAGKVFLTLAEGSENRVVTGTEYSEDMVEAGIDGAIYSRDDLTINGNGSLYVSTGYRHGIVCNDDLIITGGYIDITALEDGLHANDSVRLTGMGLTINAGDDGITAGNDEGGSFIYIESGNISIPSCYEGIEAVEVTIAGGNIDIRPDDDGINANGRGESAINITGGNITIINENGRDADGLDSNGSIHMDGGTVFISVADGGGNCAIDYGSENGGECKINGGTIIAAGGSAMAEGFDQDSGQCFIMHNRETVDAGAEVILKNAKGTMTILSGLIPCSFSSIVMSTPSMALGDTYLLCIGDESTKIVADNSSASSGIGHGMDPGHGDKPDGAIVIGPPDRSILDDVSGNAPEFGEDVSGNSGTIDEDRPGNDAGGMPHDDKPDNKPDLGESPNDRFLRGNKPDGEGGMPDMPGGEMPEGGMPPGSASFDVPNGEFIVHQGEHTATGPELALVGLSALALIAGIAYALKNEYY